MKKLLFSISIIFHLTAISQVDSCEENLRLAKLAVAKTRSHGRLVLFTKNHIDETTDFLQWLLQYEDCYTENNSLDIIRTKAGASVILFKRSKHADEEANKVKINYNATTEDTIKSVTINGRWNDMVDIYLDYWKGGVNRFSPKQKEVDYFTIVNDRVALSTSSKGFGTITVTNNIGNNIYRQYRCK